MIRNFCLSITSVFAGASVLLFLLFIPLPGVAADIPAQLQFADSLAADGDHYRAITEYKRYIFLQPDSPLLAQARLSIATSLLAGKRWQKADSSLERLFTLHPQSPETAKGRIIYAGSAYERGDFGLARERYRILLKQPIDDETVNYANYRIGWTFLEQDSPQKARNSFSLLPSQQKDQLFADLDGYQALPQKSPTMAGSLSAILPGAGQVYTGRMRQAALSFLLNGAFILGTVQAFQDENYAIGGILLFFEIGWYGGNIYNAVNNAHKYNRRAKHEYKKQMRTRLNLQLGMLQRMPSVALNYRF